MTQTTEELHSENGVYKDYRVETHDSIVSELLLGRVGIENPNSILLGGGSAAGKTRSSRILLKLDSVTNNSDKVTVVDCDSIKEMLPEYDFYSAQYPQMWSAYLHDESSHISDLAIHRCIKERRDFIYDGTMKNIDKYENLIKKLQAEHYKVNAMIFDVPIELALQRNKDRYEIERSMGKQGRLVPEKYVIETHLDVSEAFLKLKDLVDEFVLYDNKFEVPEIISLRWVNGAEQVRNPARLLEFLEKRKTLASLIGNNL